MECGPTHPVGGGSGCGQVLQKRDKPVEERQRRGGRGEGEVGGVMMGSRTAEESNLLLQRAEVGKNHANEAAQSSRTHSPLAAAQSVPNSLKHSTQASILFSSLSPVLPTSLFLSPFLVTFLHSSSLSSSLHLLLFRRTGESILCAIP